MGKFIREKQSSDKGSIDIQKFLKEAFSLYAWCIKGGSVDEETFEEYFGSNEDGREKLRMRMRNASAGLIRIDREGVEAEREVEPPLVETLAWCIHEGDRIIWEKMEEKDGIWTFNITYRHKPMKDKLFGKTVIGTEYDFEEVWTIRNNGEDRVAVIDIEDCKNIQFTGGLESGDFEMPGKKMGKIIKDKKWCKTLPYPF